jgi:hypothetical protein
LVVVDVWGILSGVIELVGHVKTLVAWQFLDIAQDMVEDPRKVCMPGEPLLYNVVVEGLFQEGLRVSTTVRSGVEVVGSNEKVEGATGQKSKHLCDKGV